MINKLLLVVLMKKQRNKHSFKIVINKESTENDWKDSQCAKKKELQKACRSLQKSLGFEPRQSPSVKSLLVFSESQEFHFLVKIFKNVALVMGF